MYKDYQIKFDGIVLKNTISYSNIITGITVREYLAAKLPQDISLIVSERKCKLYAYIGDSQEPRTVKVHAFVLQMKRKGLTSEAIIGTALEEVELVIEKIKEMFKAGYGFDVLDFQTVLEMNELCFYSSIEKSVRSKLLK